MEARTAAVALAAGRVAIGTAAFVAPGLVGRGWFGEDAGRPGTKMALRGLGARDAAMGVGLLAALDDPRRARNWVEAGIIADAGDFVATALGRGAGSRSAAAGVMLIAGGAAAAGLWIRDQLGTQLELDAAG